MSAWPSNRGARPRRAPLIVRMYAVLLWLYPARFRREYGEEMLRVLRERVCDARAEGGRGASMWLWSWALGDLLKSALAERLRGGLSMEKSVWVRVGGAAAMLGGVMVLATLVLPVVVPSLGGLSHPWGMVAANVVVPVLFLGAVAALVVPMWRRDRWIVGVGVALFVAGSVFLGAYNMLYLSHPFNADGTLNVPLGLDSVQYEGLMNYLFLGVYAQALGLVLLGIATLRTRPLSFGNAFPLLLGIFLGFYYVSRGFGVPTFAHFLTAASYMRLIGEVGVLAYLLYFLGWIALGASLWRSAPQAERARVASAR